MFDETLRIHDCQPHSRPQVTEDWAAASEPVDWAAQSAPAAGDGGQPAATWEGSSWD